MAQPIMPRMVARSSMTLFATLILKSVLRPALTNCLEVSLPVPFMLMVLSVHDSPLSLEYPNLTLVALSFLKSI